MEYIEKEINVINNIRYMAEGYGLCALEKMIPTDVPIICVYGQVNESEINFLRKVVEKCCLIGVGETAIFLLERGIKVDFIVFSSNTVYEAFEKNEGWEVLPLIVNTEIPRLIFERHQGKKFFFASGNEIENLVFDKALEVCDLRYQYNRLQEITAKDVKEYLLELATFMGDSYTLLLEGKTEGDSRIELYEKSICLGCYPISAPEVQQYFKVPVCTEKIVSWFIPLFDQNGRNFFIETYNHLALEFAEIKEIVNKSIGLYEELYEMACKDMVLKAELDCVIQQLNECTASLEAMETIVYLLNVSEKICISKESRETSNEIAEIAQDALEKYKKLTYVLERITARFLEIRQEDITIEKNCLQEAQKINNILLVGGQSQYNVLPYFVEGLKEGFQRLGIVTYRYISRREEFSKMTTDGYNHFQNTVGYEYILLINGVFLEWERYDNISECCRNMFDNQNSKLLPMFVDHPRHHIGRLPYAHQAYAVLFADNNWVKYVQNYMKDIPRPIFLPLGGVEQRVSELVEFHRRDNKIVFFGGYSDISEMEERIDAHRYAIIIKKIIQMLEKYPDMTIEAAVNQLEEENRSSYTIHHIVFATDVFEIIDTYIRQFFRQKIVDTLIRAGLPIDIYGWKNAPYTEFENVTLKDAVTFDEMLEICRSVRFILNVQPWLKSGTQERVFNTMLSGAVAVTDETEYLREKTIDETNILLYNLAEIEKLPAKIQYYMEHEVEAEQLAQNGFELAKKEHTWSCRAEELMRVLEQEVE